MEPNYGYKHTRGFIVFLIIIFCGWVIVAHSQTSYTGNLVDTNWSNGYQVPALTCWGNEQGTTNCSPGGRPYVRPDGNINFSYTFTELYQARAIADVLPNSGIGLMATGFQFNWMSKNGNGWDDGRQDQLSAYVQMYSKGGQWIEAQSYNLSFTHDWTNFSWSGTFSKERRGSELGTILYGFAGMDNNYWLGPYGPEITNVSFSLRYQPDPCVVNPLHSTECPGFMAAINKPIPSVAEATASASYSLTTFTQSSSTIPSSSTNTAMSVIRINAQRDQSIAESAAEQSTSIEKTTAQTTITAALPAQNLAISNTKSLTRSQDTQSSGQEQDQVISLSNSTSKAFSLPIQLPQVSKPIQKSDPSAKIESAIESITLDQLLAPPQVNNQQILSSTSSAQISPNRTNSTNLDSETSSTIQVSLIKMPDPIISVSDQNNVITIEKPNVESTTVALPTINTTFQNNNVMEQSSIEPFKQTQIETTPADNSSNTISNALIDKTNPLNSIISNQTQVTQTMPVFSGPAVNQKAQENDAAGGVSISQIAKIPTGFETYNVVLKDVAFYAPKEIYRNQKTVDNARALRQLGSDRLHQQMIDQQYLPR